MKSEEFCFFIHRSICCEWKMSMEKLHRESSGGLGGKGGFWDDPWAALTSWKKLEMRSYELYQPQIWLGDGWGSSMDMLVHLAASFGTVVVVFDETSSSMLTAQAEKCEKWKFCNLLQIGIQPHHHDRLAEISSNPPSDSSLVNVSVFVLTLKHC